MVAALLQAKSYVEVPVTIRSIEPSLPPKQVTSICVSDKVGGVQVVPHGEQASIIQS